jgi:hypothetical protein
MRLHPSPATLHALQVQYLNFKDPAIVKGDESNPDRLKLVPLEQIKLSPGCILNVSVVRAIAGLQSRD